MRKQIYIILSFIFLLKKCSSQICTIIDEFECEKLEQEFEVPEEYDKCGFQTPPRNEPLGNYLPTYQDMRYLVGWAELKYNSGKTRCQVIFHTKVNPDLGTKDEDYYIFYTFGDFDEDVNNEINLNSRDDSFPDGMPISCRIINIKTGNEVASLKLENIYFIWDNIEVNMPLEYENGQRGSIVELFGWPYEDVELECEFLSIAGYLGVKIFSPYESLLSDTMTEGATLNPWWYGTQVASFKYDSRYGNQKQLKKMINRCRSNNVRVYAEIVINHMTEDSNDMNPIHYSYTCNTWGPKSGSGLSPFYTHAGQIKNNYYTSQPPANEYPAIPYFPSDFHCGRGIDDWWDPEELFYGSLVGLQDINTEKEYPRKRIAGYIINLLSIGISGIMIANSRHIPNFSLAKILGYTKEYLGNELPPDFLVILILENLDVETECVMKEKLF